MAKNILITGANGQLGLALRKSFANNLNYNLFATDIADLDVCNTKEVELFIATNSIDIVVNCAAYTAVDNAEDNCDAAKKLNAVAVEYLAQGAKKQGAKLIQISTDYVFDGHNYQPYKENDPTNPTSVYGVTKLEGETLATNTLGNDCLIIRTSWLYSENGNNFVKTMLKLGETRNSLSVVCDQIGTPTYASDLADAIVEIIAHDRWVAGVYHFSNEGACSWYDFTKSIHRIAGITNCVVSPISSNDYPAKAPRPFYSVLDKTKIKTTFEIAISHWEESLVKCISNLKETKQ